MVIDQIEDHRTLRVIFLYRTSIYQLFLWYIDVIVTVFLLVSNLILLHKQSGDPKKSFHFAKFVRNLLTFRQVLFFELH